ncbi:MULTISPECIES: hypothetical protein [unclassified Ligilactobacillus]|uniref:hypothetical protein n=1 Tax=unclassified Ligilactobacillus TaxID=2767920 RepID=UPI0038527CDC
MTWIKKQLLLRAITMTGLLICFCGTVIFVNTHIPFAICSLSMVAFAFTRIFMLHKKAPNSHQRFWALHARPTYPIGDEREQNLILSAGYIAGQATMGVAIIIIFILSFANATTALTVSLPIVVTIIIAIIIAHEWLVLGFYWYLTSK